MLLGESIRRNTLLLVLFATLTAGGISSTYLATRDRITDNKRASEEAALLEIIPRDTHDNLMLDDWLRIADTDYLRLRQPHKAYRARRDGEPVAVILPATAPDGYSGPIQLIVGVFRDGTVAGVRVLEHRETPGLGDKIDLKKSDWVLDFNGRSLGNPPPARWTVRKDGGVFDQFTGATITPRAVTAAVRRALQFYAAHRNTVFTTPTGSDFPPPATDKEAQP